LKLKEHNILLTQKMDLAPSEGTSISQTCWLFFTLSIYKWQYAELINVLVLDTIFSVSWSEISGKFM